MTSAPPPYLQYSDALESIAPDEADTHASIISVMTEGQHLVRANTGRSLRISHAKAHGLLHAQLHIPSDLPPHLAQGLFAQPGTHPAIVRLAKAPGEITDDSRVGTVRGMAIKVFDVSGAHLPPFEGTSTQDFVLDTGKEFINSTAASFLQTFKPNALVAPKLNDSVKGAVSSLARSANAALNAVALNSEKMDFFGHRDAHPMDEAYYSQTALRYGRYVCKLGVVPANAALLALQGKAFECSTPDALRESTNDFFLHNAAEFDVVVQLSVGVDAMPIEDAMAKWSEEQSPYQRVGRLVIPPQAAWTPAKDSAFEDLSFSPAHSLTAHRPLGSVNRARLAAYTAMSALRRRENGQPVMEVSAPPAEQPEPRAVLASSAGAVAVLPIEVSR